MRTLSKSPPWLRPGHPIVRHYDMRQPLPVMFQVLVFSLMVGVFLLLGGLSIPVLYCLFSLVVLVQIATSSASKIYHARSSSHWDLVRLTPFTSRELLLSLWAASVRQLSRTWLMIAYRLLHGMMIVGVMVYSLLFTQTHRNEALLILLAGTLMIVMQPFAEMYFSGMVGLAGANRMPDQNNGQSLVVGVVLVYWLGYLGGVLALLLAQQMRLTSPQLIMVFLLPVLLPAILGVIALRVAETSLR